MANAKRKHLLVRRQNNKHNNNSQSNNNHYHDSCGCSYDYGSTLSQGETNFGMYFRF